MDNHGKRKNGEKRKSFSKFFSYQNQHRNARRLIYSIVVTHFFLWSSRVRELNFLAQNLLCSRWENSMKESEMMMWMEYLISRNRWTSSKHTKKNNFPFKRRSDLFLIAIETTTGALRDESSRWRQQTKKGNVRRSNDDLIN